ncbi:hypothetical protein FFLO_01799 [Filobasidium floriforme]|uniref:Uncharacterized protein n=1 Tax=Filobasidium floriforme TaxID=5210 RepID=A0A8K0JQC1_9TREE|nr:uncharacterized protein HD553DRAFT_349901 [Filobasidium floriforme]KAG7562738.1 hypothetical protein FFLO_01799 [Filobasidium floriforme]KAH8085282.1 hypothetical protein HD553DRAFT_349901 [Filobasidium floriforme]
MPIVSTTIEIAAAPAKVREIFLDFDSYPEWSKSFFQSIIVTPRKTGEINQGDQLKVVLPGATFKPVVLTNTPSVFCWRGSIPYIFSGDHSFQFNPSQSTPGHTTFVHGEDFSGMLSFLVGPTWSMGKSTRDNYEKYNVELKARVEGKSFSG